MTVFRPLQLGEVPQVLAWALDYHVTDALLCPRMDFTIVSVNAGPILELQQWINRFQ